MLSHKHFSDAHCSSDVEYKKIEMFFFVSSRNENVTLILSVL